MPVEIRMIIKDDGTIQLFGPLDNKIQMLGLIELCKMNLAEYYKEQANKIIKPAPNQMTDFGKVD